MLKATFKKAAYPAEKSIFIVAGEDLAEQKTQKNGFACAFPANNAKLFSYPIFHLIVACVSRPRRGDAALESAELKKAGLKATLPRLKILDILENSNQRHMSAEDVYKALLDVGEEVGFATVYRVLTQFEAAGLVIRHNFEGGHAVFELERGHHHDHIVCVQCGRVEEFYDQIIEDRQSAVVASKGYEINDHALVIYGNCTKTNCPYRSRG